MLIAALIVMGAALALAGYETWRQVRMSPANDHDGPALSPRYILRMRFAAGALAVALAVILFDALAKSAS